MIRVSLQVCSLWTLHRDDLGCGMMCRLLEVPDKANKYKDKSELEKQDKAQNKSTAQKKH